MVLLSSQTLQCQISDNIRINRRIKKIILGVVLSFGLLVSSLGYANDWQTLQNNAIQQFEAGKYSQAMSNVQQALKLAEKGQGETKPYMASSLNMMAMIADAQGNTSLAVEYIQRAVTLFQQSQGVHENTATLMFNLAAFYKKQNQINQALKTLQQADQMMQKLLSTQKNTQSVILQNKILSEIQQNLIQQGKAQQAEQYAQRQFELISQSQADIDPTQNLTTIRSLMILAQSYQAQNNFDKAAEVLSDIFKRFDHVKNSLNSAQWQSDYADALEILSQNTQQLDTARDVHLQAISFYEQLDSVRQQQYRTRLANHYNEIGFYYFDRKQFEQAENWFKKSEGLIQQSEGQNNAEYARLITNLAQVKDAQSQYKQALEYYQQAQSIYDEMLKIIPSKMSTEEMNNTKLAYAQTLNNIAVIYYKQRDYLQAEKLWNHGVELYTQADKAQSQQLLPVLENLVRLYRTQSRKNDEARIQYQINQIKKS